MKKFIIVILLSFFAIIPFNTKALGFEMVGEKHILANDQEVVVSVDDCNGGLLGNPNDENSVAWLLQKIFDYTKVIGPILVVILSSIDFLKVIFNGDDDAMKKAQKKLGTRLVLALLLFFIPTIVQVLLSTFKIMGDPTCGIR